MSDTRSMDAILPLDDVMYAFLSDHTFTWGDEQWWVTVLDFRAGDAATDEAGDLMGFASRTFDIQLMRVDDSRQVETIDAEGDVSDQELHIERGIYRSEFS